jgi:ATP-binding protein involved in chromosome partitioning
MLGITDRPKVHKQKILPVEKYGLKVMSIGFLVDPKTAIIWRGPMASGAVKQFLSDVDWGELDYLLFDMPPGTGDVQLTLVQTIPLTGALVVTTPQDVSFNIVRRGMQMFEKVNVPVLGVIENMSYYLCSHCGQREEIFGSGGGRQIAGELQVPFLGEVPINISTRIGGDAGRPIVYSDPESDQAQIIRHIARNLAAQVSIRNMTAEEKPAIEISLP